jgi:hypothetical protein
MGRRQVGFPSPYAASSRLAQSIDDQLSLIKSSSCWGELPTAHEKTPLGIMSRSDSLFDRLNELDLVLRAFLQALSEMFGTTDSLGHGTQH